MLLNVLEIAPPKYKKKIPLTVFQFCGTPRVPKNTIIMGLPLNPSRDFFLNIFKEYSTNFPRNASMGSLKKMFPGFTRKFSSGIGYSVSYRELLIFYQIFLQNFSEDYFKKFE